MLLSILLKNLDLISEAKQPRGTRVTKVVTTAPADAVADTNENEPEQVRTRVETIYRLISFFLLLNYSKIGYDLSGAKQIF